MEITVSAAAVQLCILEAFFGRNNEISELQPLPTAIIPPEVAHGEDEFCVEQSTPNADDGPHEQSQGVDDYIMSDNFVAHRHLLTIVFLVVIIAGSTEKKRSLQTFSDKHALKSKGSRIA